MCQRPRPDGGEIASSPRVGVPGLQGTPNSLRGVGEGRQARPGSEVQMDVGRILPCPFCGSLSVRASETTDGHFFVSCDRCGASGPMATFGWDAAWVWNAAARLRPGYRPGERRAATRDIEGAENDPSCAESGESGRNRDAECRIDRINRLREADHD